MNEILQDEFESKQKNIYPSINQSWGMLAVMVLSTIGFCFIPQNVIDYLGEDLSRLVRYLLSMGIPILYFLKRKKENGGSLEFNFKLTNFRISILLISITILLLITIRYPIIILLNTFEAIKASTPNSSNSILEFLPYTMLYSCVLAPLFEELVFRGIILNGLLKTQKPLIAIAYSSLLFGLVHLSPIQIVAAFIMGFFGGWVYFKTKSIGNTILIHAVNNIIAMGLLSLFSFLQSNGFQSLKQYEYLLIGGFAFLIILFPICLYLLIKEFKKMEMNSVNPNFAFEENYKNYANEKET